MSHGCGIFCDLYYVTELMTIMKEMFSTMSFFVCKQFLSIFLFKESDHRMHRDWPCEEGNSFKMCRHKSQTVILSFFSLLRKIFLLTLKSFTRVLSSLLIRNFPACAKSVQKASSKDSRTRRK